VPGVYRRLEERGEPIPELSPERDAALVDDLPAGSMRPKVQAAFAFVEQTGGEALVTSAEAIQNGEAGTRIVPD
jgi:carbamate kinase